jgi:hypothetical protein
MPPMANRSIGGYGSLQPSAHAGGSASARVSSAERRLGSARAMFRAGTPDLQPLGTLRRAASRTAQSAISRDLPTAGAVRPASGSTERFHCAFDVDGLCKHALATKQCFDCIKWDARAKGYYCDACFASRHPFHRLGHSFRFLYQRPPSPPFIVSKNAKAVEVAQDTLVMLTATRTAGAELEVGSKTAGDTLAAAKAGNATLDALLQRLAGNILRLRDDGWQARTRAAILIQNFWKFRIGRKLRRAVIRLMWGKVLDATTGKHFYVHRKTGATQWEPPTFGGRRVDVAMLPTVLASSLDPHAAAMAMQRAARGRMARLHVSNMVTTVYRRVTDPVTGSVYYFNLLTRAAQWRRPTCLLQGIEPAEYIKGEDDIALRVSAIVVQRAWRQARGMRLLRGLIAAKFERVLDPGGGDPPRYFYFNKLTGESTWSKPLGSILGTWEIPLAPSDKPPTPNKRHGAPMTPEEAATILAAMVRVWRARIITKKLVLHVYRRCYDTEYGAFYFWNRRTGTASWRPTPLIKVLRLAKRIEVGLPTLAAEDGESEEEGEEEEAPPPTSSEPATAAVAADGDPAPATSSRPQSRSRSRARSAGRVTAQLRPVDILRIHYNRLASYYHVYRRARVHALAGDFTKLGTHIWAALERDKPGTSAAYVAGLLYLDSPFLYPSAGLLERWGGGGAPMRSEADGEDVFFSPISFRDELSVHGSEAEAEAAAAAEAAANAAGESAVEDEETDAMAAALSAAPRAPGPPQQRRLSVADQAREDAAATIGRAVSHKRRASALAHP